MDRRIERPSRRQVAERASLRRSAGLPALLWTISCLDGGACVIGPDAPDPPEVPAAVQVQPFAPCVETRPGLEGFVEAAAVEGLDLRFPRDEERHRCFSVPGGVVASDLDADGLTDLIFTGPWPWPWVGAAGPTGFVPQPGPTLPAWFAERETLAVSAIDFDGDDLPELVLVGEGFLAVARNEGDFRFVSPEPWLLEEGYPATCFQTVVPADLDGDADLDLVLPAMDPILGADRYPDSAMPSEGRWGHLLWNEGGTFVVGQDIGPADRRWLSQVALASDRDADGDLDVMIIPDRARDGRPGLGFYRNDGQGAGAPPWVEDGLALDAQLHLDGMGVASWDANGDGFPDYCLSDLLPDLRCLASTPEGRYVETGLAWGLSSHIDAHPEIEPEAVGQWSPWSVEAVDLDHDGHVELAVAAGAPPGVGGIDESFRAALQPDALFRGGAEGFADVSWVTGFHDDDAHYGLVSFDLHGDGTRDLVLGGWDTPADLWRNPCRPSPSVEVVLVGPRGNRQAFGARVELAAGGRTQVQEVHGLRAVGQSVPALHFGLGDAAIIERVSVRFPHGEHIEAEGLAVGHRIVIRSTLADP